MNARANTRNMRREAELESRQKPTYVKKKKLNYKISKYTGEKKTNMEIECLEQQLN